MTNIFVATPKNSGILGAGRYIIREVTKLDNTASFFGFTNIDQHLSTHHDITDFIINLDELVVKIILS